MEKLCKRCLFRTPHQRAICQVCGHNKFLPLEGAAAKTSEKALAPMQECKSVERVPAPAQAQATASANDTGMPMQTEAGAESPVLTFARSYCAEAVDELKKLFARVEHATSSVCEMAGSLMSKPEQDPSDIARSMSQHRSLPAAPKLDCAPKTEPIRRNSEQPQPALQEERAPKAEVRKPVAAEKTDDVIPAYTTRVIKARPELAAATPLVEPYQQPLVLGDAASQKARLNELLEWFQAYGANGLIVPAHDTGVDDNIKNAA